MFGRLMLTWLIAGMLPTWGAESKYGAMDPARGDAMVAAVAAGDAKKLQALLLPEDRKELASFKTSEDTQVTYQGFSNLLSPRAESQPTACDVVLLEYGLGFGGHSFGHYRDFSQLKKHYPKFTETLGRAAMKFAAEKGKTRMMEGLLASGVPVRASDLEGAVRGAHVGVIKLLVKAGVQMDRAVIEIEGRNETPEKYARKFMNFAVLEALGKMPAYADELKEFRKDRPGNGALQYVGHWRLTPTLGISLNDDGSGFLGAGEFSNDPSYPILWKLIDTPMGRAVHIDEVPHAHPERQLSNPYAFSVDGDTMRVSKRDGSETKAQRMEFSDDQRSAYDQFLKANVYTGPVGEWLMDVDTAFAGSGEKPPEAVIAQMKKAKFRIEKDGTAVFDGPRESKARLAPSGNPDEYTFAVAGAPLMLVRGEDDWRRLILAVPQRPEKFIFTKKP